MKKTRESQPDLSTLRCKPLVDCWSQFLDMAEDKDISKHALLKAIARTLVAQHQAQIIETRISRSGIPRRWSLNTFPFDRQPTLSREQVQNLLDSGSYYRQGRNILFVGPTGVGKTSLASSYLIEAIKNGCTGKMIRFPQFMRDLKKATEKMTELRTIRSFAWFDCLVIDEIGYVEVDATQVSNFFEIIAARDEKCTIITSNLGFEDWGSFLKNDHLVGAMLDRLTANAEFFDLANCQSIRPEGGSHDKP